VRPTPALALLAALVACVIGGAALLHPGGSPLQTGDLPLLGGGTAAAEADSEVAADVAAEPLELPDPLPRRTLEVPILMYHRIAVLQGDEAQVTRDLTVEPPEFGLQMQWLVDNGYTSISQRQLYDALMEGAELPERPVLITFDDGYRGIARIAAPIMGRVGLTGTAYVITDRIAEDRDTAPQWLTWSMLRRLERRGWDIGSHTVSHREIPSLDRESALEQLRGSRFRLEKELGHPVQWFCYPAGRVSPEAVELVREAGYVLAVTTEQGTLQSASDPLRLTRVRVANDTGVSGLAAALGDDA
jgi:peptidoglycan/xylan/chitin deacetylase (PgdA/CDA1 family)